MLWRPFDNRELATIAMLATLHFGVSFAARMFGAALGAVAGPFAVFLDGIGGEGIPCLLVAAAIVLVPRVGTATLTIATVWLLNAITSGTFSVVSVTMVAASIVLHELILGLAGVTLESPWRRPTATVRIADVIRTALAVGLANGAALYVQFAVSMYWYRFYFDPLYVHAVALVTGVGYGAIGAAIGSRWGFELRRGAP